MVTNLQLGGEVLVLDDTNLLCDHCKQKIEAAKEAVEAVRRLQALTGQQQTMLALPEVAAPPPPWEGKRGKDLPRDHRLAKAQHLLATGKHTPPPKPARKNTNEAKAQLPPKPEHRTLNGTVVTAPHLLLPRKKITAAAERDIDKVVDGRMKTADWVHKHGYSSALLRKRLEMRGVLDPKDRKRDGYNQVPGYKPPSEKIPEADLEAALKGRVKVVELSKKYNVPGGTVYRLIDEYRKRTKSTPATSTKAGRPFVAHITDEDFELLRTHAVTLESMAKKYKIQTVQIRRRLETWLSEHKLFMEPDQEELFANQIVGDTSTEPAPAPQLLDELKDLANGGA